MEVVYFHLPESLTTIFSFYKIIAITLEVWQKYCDVTINRKCFYNVRVCHRLLIHSSNSLVLMVTMLVLFYEYLYTNVSITAGDVLLESEHILELNLIPTWNGNQLHQ